jgi:RHS repeat-associated protein
MAMKVVYTVLDGEVLHENRAGTKRDYVPDPLGSTIALLDSTQTQTDTFTYWPYGEVKTRTGTTATPFQFVGTKGYYRDSTGRSYVRARTLRADLTRWLTEDPIGMPGGDVNLSKYAHAAPVRFTDQTGLSPILIGGGLVIGAAYEWYCSEIGKGHARDLERQFGIGHPRVDKLVHCMAYCMMQRCSLTGYPAALICESEMGPGKWDPKDSPKDIIANQTGIACATAGGASPGLPFGWGSYSACLNCCYNRRLDQLLDGDPPYPAIPAEPPYGDGYHPKVPGLVSNLPPRLSGPLYP